MHNKVYTSTSDINLAMLYSQEARSPEARQRYRKNVSEKLKKIVARARHILFHQVKKKNEFFEINYTWDIQRLCIEIRKTVRNFNCEELCTRVYRYMNTFELEVTCR